jgi:hypothetical protein
MVLLKIDGLADACTRCGLVGLDSDRLGREFLLLLTSLSLEGKGFIGHFIYYLYKELSSFW